MHRFINNRLEQRVIFTLKGLYFCLVRSLKTLPYKLSNLGLKIKFSIENLEPESLPVVVNFINQQPSRLLQKYGVSQ
ncbi:hypothetical protein RC083_01010 [Pseudoalteromonas haloplanktis]|uniref:Transposase n=1 Tax=Pseudoalteromonas haloplanktis TaxID=228 RepID=A0ABU1B6X2_PSEHA|nr:hypothetical protein [Pseudoalteromonas haloplanktis]MDQ9090163.1 hypothetical protein [Pseudoalteromonas haloplanktis]